MFIDPFPDKNILLPKVNFGGTINVKHKCNHVNKWTLPNYLVLGSLAVFLITIEFFSVWNNFFHEPHQVSNSPAETKYLLRSQIGLRDFTFTFHFHALRKEMATHSSVLAWRIPGTGEPGGLSSMGSHRVGHDWSDLAAARSLTSILSIFYIFEQVCLCTAIMFLKMYYKVL